MVKKDSIYGIHAVCFAVIYRDPVGKKFGNGIWRARIKWSVFALRHSLHFTIHFGAGCLVDLCLFFQSEQSNCLEYAQGAYPICVGGVFRRFKTNFYMTLCREIVYFIGLYFLDNSYQVGRVGKIAVMQLEVNIFFRADPGINGLSGRC